MNAHQLLQAMRPMGIFTDWTREDVLAAIITEMRWHQQHPFTQALPAFQPGRSGCRRR